VNEIFDELRRVSKLAGDRISLSIEEAAKKEQSKFDLGGYE
jgi:hypothetical protein